MADILGIHGIAQSREDTERLTRTWSDALAQGWAGPGPSPEVAVPHLSPLLQRDRRLLGDDDLTDEQAAYMALMLREYLGDPDDDELARLAQRGATLGGPRWPPVLLPLIRALDGNLPRPVRDALVRLVREVDAYLNVTDVRDRVRDRLFGAGQQPDLVIGHSLGSVIAYDLAVHDAPVPTLMTLGSPLSLRTVREHPTLTTGASDPPTAWTNVWDPNDIVTAGTGLARFWPLTDLTADNGDEPHAITRYLAHPEVGATVVTLLGP